jgi:radical SAM superfamily enzyme YgiQ (UPF0313 family)
MRQEGNTMRAAKPPSVLHVFLIKPSKYDDDGFVIRHWRGVLPSNTLACLNGLTEDVRHHGLLGEVEVTVHLVDEAVDKLLLGSIAILNRRPGCRVVVCLVGVQTNQFCRAADIAQRLRKERVAVIIGGFHVSGMLALFQTISPEIQQLIDVGVSVVAGEVEHRWAEILRDAYEGNLKSIYRFINELPDISNVPAPLMTKHYLRKFVSSNFGTIDCGRGCPFSCSFCTIINVQGRKGRHRSPECIADALRHNYLQHGVSFYFFTDDDFARNPAWEKIFDKLIIMRERDAMRLKFMMQVDAPSAKIPGFVEKAARAGCRTVFIGIESLNPRNLKETGKTQNHIEEYRSLIDVWHRAGVSTHASYIIGLPHDTEESVRDDVARLMTEVQPQRASFFMLMPLPGSKDHKQMVDAGVCMDADYNTYDASHETLSHPHLKNGAWTRAYEEAWHSFYGFENMKAILSRARPENYWDIFRYFYWYKNSIRNEATHPMITGFLRIKDRTARRAGFPIEGRLRHLRRRIPEIYRYVRDVIALTVEMEELWLQTRGRSETERRILEEFARMRSDLGRGLRISELQAVYARAKLHMPSIEVPSRLSLLKDNLSLLRVNPLLHTRGDLTTFWASVHRCLSQRRIEAVLRLDRLVLNGLREIRLAVGFLLALGTTRG